MTRPFDIENGLTVCAEARMMDDPLMVETARLADKIADGFRADFDMTLDMETVGKALVVAAASVMDLAASGGTPATVIANMIGLAGENLVRTARARAAEQAGEVEGEVDFFTEFEFMLTWHPVAADPVEVPLSEDIAWCPEELGQFRLSTREVPLPAVEHPWCPHPECHDRLHGDSVHTDERGRPFTGKPGDPYEWTDKPEVSGA